MARKGWHNESARHSLAARGCSTKPQKHARASSSKSPTEDDIVHQHIVDESYRIMESFQSEVHDVSVLYTALEAVIQASHEGKIDIEGEKLSVVMDEKEKAHKKLEEITVKYLNEYEFLLEGTDQIKDEKRRRKTEKDIFKEAEKINSFRKSRDLKERTVMFASNRGEMEAEAAAERAMDYEYERSHEIREDYPDRNW